MVRKKNLLLATLITVAILLVSAACTDTAEPTTAPESTEVPKTADTSTPSPVPSATPTQTSEPKATSTSAATPSTVTIISEDGAALRPGASTWWHPRETLPSGTELELQGYDPDFPDWVYVSTADGESTGWMQTADLEINRELSALPKITPIPTLTPEPATDCTGGPLKLDAWEVDKKSTGDTWTATIFAEGHGGTCIYTYAWNGEVKGESMTTSITFDVIGPSDSAIIGTVSVTSGGETVEKELFIKRPK